MDFKLKESAVPSIYGIETFKKKSPVVIVLGITEWYDRRERKWEWDEAERNWKFETKTGNHPVKLVGLPFDHRTMKVAQHKLPDGNYVDKDYLHYLNILNPILHRQFGVNIGDLQRFANGAKPDQLPVALGADGPFKPG